MLTDKTICWFDTETTGLDKEQDRIIELGIIVTKNDDELERHHWYINPDGRPITKEASDVNGITIDMLAESPKFSDIANEVIEILNKCDIIAGQNIMRFDVPLLSQELMRSGIVWPTAETKFYDTFTIESLLYPKTLGAMYKRYTGKDIEEAHQALADTEACIAVMHGQSKKFDRLDPNSIVTSTPIDIFGYIIERDGQAMFSFGKYKGQRVIDQFEYAVWMLQSNFPHTTKAALRKVLGDRLK